MINHDLQIPLKFHKNEDRLYSKYAHKDPFSHQKVME